MSTSTKFWNRIAARYAKQPVADEASYQKKLNKTREYLSPNVVALEFGCGTGTTALAHAPYVKQIDAVDSSTAMIEIAKGKAAASNIENISFDVAAIEELQDSDQKYDAVMAHSVLHLLSDEGAAIRKSYAFLKCGGFFITSTMCMGDSFKFKVVATLVSLGVLFGLLPRPNVFTKEKLVTQMLDAGFSIEYEWQPGKDRALFIVAKKPSEEN